MKFFFYDEIIAYLLTCLNTFRLFTSLNQEVINAGVREKPL